MISSYRHDNSPSAIPDGFAPLRYLDVVLILVAAPILLLIGVPAVGYAVGAGAWLALRIVGIGLERYVRASTDMRRQISLRLAYLLARVFLLALAVILVRRGEGKNDALATLGVVVVAFTIQLVISYAERPRSR